jgi:alpha-1,2-mannosyltransferase
VPFNVMTGQNGFFTCAILVGGFGLIGRSPVVAGALLGVLTFKPQMWLMVPVALVSARQWRALGGAAASALILALLSLIVFGPEIWRSWLSLVTGMDEAFRAWVTSGRLNGMSVFACATWVGASPAVANLAQGVAIALAAAIVYLAFRRPAPGALQLAVLLAATMLAAPHVSTSDAVLLALAASLFVVASGPLGPAQLMLAAAVWISPFFNPPSVFRPGCLTPVLILLLLGVLIAEIREKGAPGDA